VSGVWFWGLLSDGFAPERDDVGVSRNLQTCRRCAGVASLALAAWLIDHNNLLLPWFYRMINQKTSTYVYLVV
jgi:hypothetical protein